MVKRLESRSPPWKEGLSTKLRLGCSFHYDWDARSCFSEPFAHCVLGSTFPIGSCEIGEAQHLSSFKEREKIKKDNEVG